MRRLLACCVEPVKFDQQTRMAPRVTSDAISAIEGPSRQSRPYFLFVNYMDAHAPYIADVPSGYDLPSGAGAPVHAELLAITDDLLHRRGGFPEDKRRLIMERYDAGIASEDAAVEDLFTWLKHRGDFDRALIVVVADHGESFGERGHFGHAYGVTDDQIRVPLIIKYPGQTSGEVVPDVVSHIDILPTILDTLSLTIPKGVQGISLRGPIPTDRAVVAEAFPSTPTAKSSLVINRVERALRYGPYKLIVHEKGANELFDLQTDPREEHSLLLTDPQLAAAMEKRFKSWLAQVPVKAKPAPMSAEQIKSLKGLGYLR